MIDLSLILWEGGNSLIQWYLTRQLKLIMVMKWLQLHRDKKDYAPFQPGEEDSFLGQLEASNAEREVVTLT